MALIHAVRRLSELPPPVRSAPDFVAGDLAINFQAREVSVAGTIAKLTPFEYKLLFHLVRNAGRLMLRRALMERIWGADY